MKTYEEMARCALEARDEHEKKRKRKIYIAKRAVPAFAGVFAAFIIGLGIRNNFKKPDTFPTPDNVVEIMTTTSTDSALPHTSGTTVTTLAANSAAANTAATITSAAKTETTSVTSATGSVQTQSAATQETAPTTAVQTTASTLPKTTTVTTTAEPAVSFTTTTDDRPSGTDYGGIPSGASGNPSSGDMNVGGKGGDDPVCGGSAPSSCSSDPWYDLPVYQAYADAFIDGYAKIYHSGYKISSDIIGGDIAAARMKSSYPVEGTVRTFYAYAYYINGFSSENAVAIRFDGQREYYLYLTDDMDLDNIKKQIPPLEQ